MKEQSPAGSLIKLIFCTTNTVFEIRATKNATVRSDTAEQHKHCTVGFFKLKKSCAKQITDIRRVIEPRTSPLIAVLDRGAHDGKPEIAAKT